MLRITKREKELLGLLAATRGRGEKPATTGWVVLSSALDQFAAQLDREAEEEAT